MKLVLDMPFKSDIKEAQLECLCASKWISSGAQMVFNHGGIGVYETLIRKARAHSIHTAIYAVNSGSAQLAKTTWPTGTRHRFLASRTQPVGEKNGHHT